MRLRLTCFVFVFLVGVIAAACNKIDLPLFSGGSHSLSAANKWTGQAIFIERCQDCHTVHERGGIVGPDLSRVGARRNRIFLEQAIMDSSKLYPGTMMPPYDSLPKEQKDLLLDYLTKLL